MYWIKHPFYNGIMATSPFSLILTQGWYEIISDVCYHFACLNRGHCVIENGNPKCSCTPGYGGEHCEVKGKIYFIW